ncbi:MAG: hypothetical protein H6558_18290 [Lewinellaceae bacterium]|nr:hypothetical protein [Lewinellaceae bacterium]
MTNLKGQNVRRFIPYPIAPMGRLRRMGVLSLPDLPATSSEGTAGGKKTSIMRDQNYQELVRKVTMYLDNELSESAERELLREIKSNPAYLKVLSQEKSFREFIKSKIHRRKPSPALIQSIKEKIRIAPA